MKSMKNPKDKIYIFVSCPYSDNPAANVRKAIDVCEELMNMGYFPIAPNIWHFHDIIHPHHYSVWLDTALAWIEKCDAVLKLGDSNGTQKEEMHAKEHEIPVFGEITKLCTYFGQSYYERNYI
jgi:hypothetical protein